MIRWRLCIAVSTLLVLSGCCGFIHCDCAQPQMIIAYHTMGTCSDDLPVDLEILAYDTNLSPGSAAVAGFYTIDCRVVLNYAVATVWTIASDDAGIADTVRVLDATIGSSESRCCKCGGTLSDARIDINGTVYETTSIVR